MLVALALYAPALGGPFVSDDMHYVANNDYIHTLSPANAAAILDPTGPATIAIVNYAPVQLFVHALAWQIFGSDTRGHHALGLLLHVLASLLLVAVFRASGIPLAPALFAGSVFLVHPANVEAVAWISQLKSTLCLCFSLAAVLLWQRRPGGASVAFALALGSKGTALFALPAVAWSDWSARRPLRWGWLAGWLLLFAGYAVAEFATHQRSGAAESLLRDDPLLWARTLIAHVGHYALMATTTLGLSAFHDPEPARSWLDPRWLVALPLLAVMAFRAGSTAWRRSPEFAYWSWALVAYLPISQIFPFLYPVADRYLYFVLPGLLGAVAFAGSEFYERLPAQAFLRSQRGRRALLAIGAVLLVGAGLRARERARIWRSAAFVIADAAAHYPEGKGAQVLAAKRAGRAGDAQTAAFHLQRALERGYYRFEQIETDADFESIRRHPAFREVVGAMARRWIERSRSKPDPTQVELRSLAHAHIALGEHREALRLLEAALTRGGPRDEEVAADLQALRSALETGRSEDLRVGAPSREFF